MVQTMRRSLAQELPGTNSETVTGNTNRLRLAFQLKLAVSLFRLRYQLLFRQMTHSAMQIVQVILVVAFTAITAVVSFNAGIAASFATIRLQHGERLVFVMLWTAFSSGITFSVLLGIGPKGVFSEPGLRMYPIIPALRMAYSHLLTMLTPVWIGISVFIVTICVSLWFVGHGWLVLNLTAALLFILTTYTIATLSLRLVGQALAGVRPVLVTTSVLLGVLYAGISAGASSGVVRFTNAMLPPTLFEMAAFADVPGTALVAVLGLLMWTVSTTVILFVWSRKDQFSR